MRFVDRQEELGFLEQEYEQPSFRFIPLYGRRRIGKTRLVREFIKGKPAIYFLADTVSEPEQLKNLGRSVGEYFKDMEFLARVKDMHPDCLRIILSGQADMASVLDAINDGAVYKFFTKPWDDAQLRERIREAFRVLAALSSTRLARP